MNEDKEFVHKLLDGEISDFSQDDVDKIYSQTSNNEFTDLLKTVQILESSERFAAGRSFTSEVMRKLPSNRPSPLHWIRNFLFGSRVLKWNVATAAAAVCFLVIVFFAGLSRPVKNQLYPVNAVSYQQNPETVVRINFYAPDAHKVALAGDFNKWDTERNLLKDQGNGIWTIEVPLKPGVYKYMFVVDGKKWIPDPNAETYRDDGFGLKNAVLRVNSI